ncbi:MAG: Sir2 silent information regulator family NAD-dependent deacetylase [Proteobacteria bacterium]|nr:Sir2 silent information regulator family NAD-dependent deacetylase [Pseudomonadota bacterium]
MNHNTNDTKRILSLINEAEAIVIGAGAGLSTSAGFTYSGERFEKYFGDFASKYGFSDMYSGGFYPFETPEELWAYWSRYIMINRYMDAPKPVYQKLLSLVQDKNYFVITTNVDHCFQKAGFDKKRLFYTQGDYGLFQCSEPCHQKTYDNETQIRAMYNAQKDMKIPADLIPYCPVCKKPMRMNLRSDDTFVQDEGWYEAAERYHAFLIEHRVDDDGKVLFLELGVGANTPGIIKYPFWQMTAQNPNAIYVCINFGEAIVPDEISSRSMGISADIGEVLEAL